jgi:hypothetical protein
LIWKDKEAQRCGRGDGIFPHLCLKKRRGLQQMA